MHISIVTCTYQLLHAHINCYMYISIVTCTYQLLHAHINCYMHISIVTCTYQFLVHNNEPANIGWGLTSCVKNAI